MTESIKIISVKDFLKENKKPIQEDIWDNISDLWSDYKKKPFFHVEEFLKGKKGLVIDLGCGCGRNMIVSKDIEYYGVDFSTCQLGCAITTTKEKGINAKFFKMSADKLSKKEFKSEMFNYGLFIATLHCIETPEKRIAALKEFYRVLKPGAEGLISVWNSSDKRFLCVKNGGDIYMSWKKDGKEHMRYYYLYSKEGLLELLKSVGFKVLDIYENDEKNDRFSKKNLIVRVGK